MVSVVFGESSIFIDWFPQCHGLWLDRGEFKSLTDYWWSEEVGMKPQEIEQEDLEELKEVWTGGPESRLEDLRDALAASSAILNTSLFDHPKLFNFLHSIPG